MSDLSVVIINWNTRDLLLRCIRTIDMHKGDVQVEIVVVDNASTDDSVESVRREYPSARVLVNDTNVGFARANNQGVVASSAPLALLLNSDAFLTDGALQALLEVMAASPHAALVGAHLRNADGTFQASHTPFPNLWQEFLILSGIGRLTHGRWYPSHAPELNSGAQVVEYVEGACMLVRKDVYRAIGGLDEGFFMYAEEVDLCYRIRAADWQVWYAPRAEVIHLGGGSSGKRKPQREADLYRSRVRFFRKHYGAFPALILKAQIILLATVKTACHGVLYFATQGRRGRRVPPLSWLFGI